MKKVGKTTRKFRYNLNQIPDDYTVELRNRFNRLDLIECLMNYGQRFVTLYRNRDQESKQEKERWKGKWWSEEALQIAVKRREKQRRKGKM